MPRRTALLQKIPWSGGVNDSVDPGVLSDDDLVRADNVVFATSGSRLKRSAHLYFDEASAPPSVIGLSSSGTTRTLLFSEPLQVSSPFVNQRLVVGESIIISSSDSSENDDYGVLLANQTLIATVGSIGSAANFVDADVNAGTDSITATAHGYLPGMKVTLSSTGTLPTGLSLSEQYYVLVTDANTIQLSLSLNGSAVDIVSASGGGTHTVTPLSNNSITYTRTGSLAASLAAPAGTISLSRGDKLIGIYDFNYYNNQTDSRLQEWIAVAQVNNSSQAIKFFSFDSSGRRTEILPASAVALDFDDGDVDVGDDEIDLTVAHNFTTGQRVRFSNSGGALPTGLSAGTDYYVIRISNTEIAPAATIEDAYAGLPVNISAASGTGTHTVTPQDAPGTYTAAQATRVLFSVINERLILSFDALGIVPRQYDPVNSGSRYDVLPGSPPDFFLQRNYQGRIFANQKDRPDLLHYCETGNPYRWNGFGDSGAIPIREGDGDRAGIQVIFPPFKQRLWVAKGQKTYQLAGDSPETYVILDVTEGLGANAPAAAVPVDLDDVMYVSDKGFHSLAATDAYGDFRGAYLSEKLQNTFGTWEQSRLDYMQGVYIQPLNSLCFMVSEADVTDRASALWFYHVPGKRWYRWPSLDAQCIAVGLYQGRKTLFYGTSNGRLVRTQAVGLYADFGDQVVPYNIKTGTIYPDGNAQTIKAFKKLSFYFRPRGSFSFTATVKIDNFPSQAVTFNQASQGAELGEDFVLGSSVLSFDNVFAPFTEQIDGFGRGCTIEITQNGLEEQVEIYGFAIEYESADLEQESKSAGTE